VQRIRIATPDIDHQLGYVATALRQGRSGFRKRIYGRRYTAAVDGAIVAPVESPQVFMLLTEIAGDTATFDYFGQAQLDMRRRLKQVHGYRALRLYPMPDARYEMHCRVQFRPAPLDHDQDTPRLGEDGVDALLQKALEFFYDFDSQPDMSVKARAVYRDMLSTLTKRYGSLDWGVTRREPARVRSPTAARRSKAVRWDGIT